MWRFMPTSYACRPSICRCWSSRYVAIPYSNWCSRPSSAIASSCCTTPTRQWRRFPIITISPTSLLSAPFSRSTLDCRPAISADSNKMKQRHATKQNRSAASCNILSWVFNVLHCFAGYVAESNCLSVLLMVRWYLLRHWTSSCIHFCVNCVKYF